MSDRPPRRRINGYGVFFILWIIGSWVIVLLALNALL